MVKNSVNRSKDEDAYIQGQAYHMDLVFVSGPAKFDDLRTTTEDSVTVKQSRDGYIGFWTIIDVASRQLWTHLIKIKDPPTQYIDQFLKRHGMQDGSIKSHHYHKQQKLSGEIEGVSSNRKPN